MEKVRSSKKTLVLILVVVGVIIVGGVASMYVYGGHFNSKHSRVLQLGVVSATIADGNSSFGPLIRSTSNYTGSSEFLPLLGVPYLNATVAYYNATPNPDPKPYWVTVNNLTTYYNDTGYFPFSPLVIVSIRLSSNASAEGFFNSQWNLFNASAITNYEYAGGGAPYVANGSYNGFRFFMGYYAVPFQGYGTYDEIFVTAFSGQYAFTFEMVSIGFDKSVSNIMKAEMNAMFA